MDQRTIQILFALLRSAICGTKLTEEERSAYSHDLISDLLKISSKHDVAHLLALGLKQNELILEENSDIEQYIFKAVYRYARLEYEYDNLCAALEKTQIPFIPLKGAVIRKYYPEPWMRTSCDIDVLVHEGDLQKAVSYLSDNLGYKRKSQNSHDISMFTGGGVHVEVHYGLLEDGKVNSAAAVLQNVWNVLKKCTGCNCRYEMPDEMFYFYHIAHMAKHFENGGCGIRPFLDIWILNHRFEFDREKREKLLSDGGLNIFANQAELLAEIWFGNAGYTKTAKQMEDYILRGGVYGTNTNRIAVQQQKNGGKVKYALSKIFIPYEEIKFHYPILQKHKWLTPIMEVRRWGKLVFCGHLKRTVKELEYNAKISANSEAEVRIMLKNIGL